MIIKSIKLTGFGKFSEKEIYFDDGLNILYGENEAGKTTIHTFIRGMLFGIEKQRGRAGVNDTYSKYEPQDGSALYGGSMIVEKDGKEYRLERVFRRDRKSFTVTDLTEGRELSESEISQLLSGIDEKCYYNTISISQLGSTTDEDLESALKNYAANIGASGNVDINVTGAIDSLTAKKKKIISDNRLNREREINEALTRAKEDYDVSMREQSTIIAAIEQKQSEAGNLTLKKNEYGELYSKQIEEQTAAGERRISMTHDISVREAEIEKLTSDITAIENREQTIRETLDSNGIKDVDSLNYQVERALNKPVLPVPLILLAMLCVGAALGFIFAQYDVVFSYYVYWMKPLIFAVLAVIFTILAVVRFGHNKKKKSVRLDVLKEMRLDFDKLSVATNEKKYIDTVLEGKKKELVDIKDKLSNEIPIDDSVSEYERELLEVEKQEKEYYDAIAKDQWILEQMQEKELEIDQRLENLQQELSRMEAAKEEVLAIDEAIDSIKEISEKVRNEFGEKINSLASSYISKITDGKYSSLTVDDKLDISITEKFFTIQSHRMSKGTMEQVYLALRMAAKDIIFENDSMPILMDDALAMYDNKRMGNTIKFLSEEAGQVILFSCHTREKLMADKIGAEYKFIKL